MRLRKSDTGCRCGSFLGQQRRRGCCFGTADFPQESGRYWGKTAKTIFWVFHTKNAWANIKPGFTEDDNVLICFSDMYISQ